MAAREIPATAAQSAAAPSPAARRLYFPYIDAARALAVTGVLLCHLAANLKWEPLLSPRMHHVLSNGWMGVDLFFVISGFVISLSLIRNIEDFGIHGYKKPYFKSRLARIVPLYFLTSWCFLVLVQPESFNNSAGALWTNILSHAFFVHHFSTETSGALNGPTWTIAIEMQFYVFIAIVIKWLPLRRPLLVCFLAILIALAWRFGAWLTFTPGLEVWDKIIRVDQLPGRLDAFGLGYAVALIVWNPRHPLHRYFQPGGKNTLLWFAVAMIASAIAWKAPQTQPDYWENMIMVVFFRTILVAAFAAWVCFFIVLWNSKRLIAILFPVLYVGRISYGVYLWHTLVISSILKTGVTHPFRAGVLITILVLVVSSFTWHFLEQPLIQKYRDKPSPAK